MLLICLMYMGTVVLLHIFGKVQGLGKQATAPEPDMGGFDDGGAGAGAGADL